MSNELSSYAVRKTFPARDEPAFSNRDIQTVLSTALFERRSNGRRSFA